MVKIGGSTLGTHDTTLQDLVSLQRQGSAPVVVHGGGAFVTRWLEVHQIPSRFIRGLRVTDRESLSVVTAVLAGLVNKELVASLQALGGRAVGLSGADGGLLTGEITDPELGYVGETTALDLSAVHALREAGFLPVVATVGLDGTGAGGLLNFNADTVAGELAVALEADLLVFLTDVPGVQDGNGTVRTCLTPAAARGLIDEGTASGGMIPKLEACLRARTAQVECRIVDGRREHALLHALSDRPAGTKVW